MYVFLLQPTHSKSTNEEFSANHITVFKINILSLKFFKAAYKKQPTTTKKSKKKVFQALLLWWSFRKPDFTQKICGESVCCSRDSAADTANSAHC